MKFSAIIVAAGSSTRFGAPKQFVEIAGKTVLQHSIDAFTGSVSQVIVVVSQQVFDDLDKHLDLSEFESPPDFVVGGDSRSISVRNGLKKLDPNSAGVLVHDGARPLVSQELIIRTKEAIEAGNEVVIPVLELSESLYTDAGEPLERSSFRVAQTPQGFTRAAIEKAHHNAEAATDDASLAVAAGYDVNLIVGSIDNLKVTFPSDIAAVRHLLAKQKNT